MYMNRTEVNIVYIDVNKEIDFIRTDVDNITQYSSFPLYIWLRSTNGRNYFEHYLKLALFKHHINYDGLIENDYTKKILLTDSS
jgi:hypothetical protein